LECNGDPFNCKRCNESYYLIKSDNRNLCSKCDQKNQTLYFEQNSNCNIIIFFFEKVEILLNFIACYHCVELLPDCRYCENSSICNQCLDDYFLHQGSCRLDCYKRGKIYDFSMSLCVEKCPSFFYPFFDSRINQNYCLKCGENCEKCFDSNSCVTCGSGWFLYTNKCLEACPKNHVYIELERRCSNCPIGQLEAFFDKKFLGCKECSSICKNCYGNTNNCSSCFDDYFYLNGSCVSNCPFGTVNDLRSGTCSPCHQSCLECFGTSNSSCSRCSEDKILLENSCINDCPLGYYLYRIEDAPLKCKRCKNQGE
jgi:proprotein convertase subtilisin/kexin type 5